MSRGTHDETAKRKIINSYDALAEVARGLRAVGRKVVVTIGSWDLLHIGHLRYLAKARSHGDLLIVGVDTDETVRFYKGELRPIVPYEERTEMLTYQSCVDFVTPIVDVDEKGKWQYGLIEKVRPDIFIAVEDSYPKEQLADIRKYSTEVIVLPRQAENTSTTNLVQNAVKKHMNSLHPLLGKKAS